MDKWGIQMKKPNTLVETGVKVGTLLCFKQDLSTGLKQIFKTQGHKLIVLGE